jgi:hypothetical protein
MDDPGTTGAAALDGPALQPGSALWRTPPPIGSVTPAASPTPAEGGRDE